MNALSGGIGKNGILSVVARVLRSITGAGGAAVILGCVRVFAGLGTDVRAVSRAGRDATITAIEITCLGVVSTLTDPVAK